MEIRLETKPWHQVPADWLVVGIDESSDLSGPLSNLDAALDGRIMRLRESGDLTGKLAETLAVHDVTGMEAKRLLLVGLGQPSELNVARLEKALMTATRQISHKQDVSVAYATGDIESLSAEATVQTISFAATVGCIGQDLYRAEPSRHPFQSVAVLSEKDDDETAITGSIERGRILGEAVNLTRELVNRPAADIYPETVAERAQELSAEFGLTCEVLDRQRLQDEKMGSLLGVAQGSDRPPRVVILEHRGGGENAPTLALVGKGVTFDSGGLSLKTNESMKTMKCDMAGSATVLGAMVAVARLNLPVNVCGYLGLVENMVNGSSFKLGDVLTARNGVTIEVLNTDAEGRLVLADVLSLAADRGADRIIDLATLTGACVVALGEEITGAFTNQQEWCDAVQTAARSCGEEVWQMPMNDFFGDLLKSDVADIKNVANRWGGAITAAKFLEKFVSGKPWVHLDIAGPSFGSSNKPHREGGASGCMVRTLVETVARFSG